MTRKSTSAASKTFTFNDVSEERLLAANEDALRANQVSPLVKEELRLTIITKRHARGEEDISVDFKEPVKNELTPEEQRRRERRKEQNRRAARKCRQKKKNQQFGTNKNFEAITERNKNLMREIEKLKKEKKDLETLIHEHVISGRCNRFKVELAAEISATPTCPATPTCHLSSTNTDDIFPYPEISREQTLFNTTEIVFPPDLLPQYTTKENSHEIPSVVTDLCFNQQADEGAMDHCASLASSVGHRCALSESSMWSEMPEDVGSDVELFNLNAGDVTAPDDVFYVSSGGQKTGPDFAVCDDCPSPCDITPDFLDESLTGDQNYFERYLIFPEP